MSSGHVGIFVTSADAAELRAATARAMSLALSPSGTLWRHEPTRAATFSVPPSGARYDWADETVQARERFIEYLRAARARGAAIEWVAVEYGDTVAPKVIAHSGEPLDGGY